MFWTENCFLAVRNLGAENFWVEIDLSAKNALTNVYGFSPNQLVFGKNPNYPCIENNKPPANSSICHSEVVEEKFGTQISKQGHKIK